MRPMILLSLAQSAFSGYLLYLSSISISNLIKYEEKAKKAAEWSQTAADELWKTRTTQASAVVSVLATFLSSLYMVFSATGVMGKIFVAVVNIGILFAAAEHVGAFWRTKVKIPLPGVGEYNEAIGKTNEVRSNMWNLAASWIVVGVLGLVLG